MLLAAAVLTPAWQVLDLDADAAASGSLRAADLSHNAISVIRPDLSALSRLTQLVLDGNSLTSCDGLQGVQGAMCLRMHPHAMPAAVAACSQGASLTAACMCTPAAV